MGFSNKRATRPGPVPAGCVQGMAISGSGGAVVIGYAIPASGAARARRRAGLVPLTVPVTSGRSDLLMRLREALNMGNSKQPARQSAASPRIRGLLLLYVIALVPFLLHTAVLTVGSIVTYAHPAAAGLHSRVPLGFLIYYVTTNVALLAYGIVLFALMTQRRRSAIANNAIFNILAVAFLLSWHLLGEKSAIGTVIDSVPNLVGAAYILLSTRVRSTFSHASVDTATQRPTALQGDT